MLAWNVFRVVAVTILLAVAAVLLTDRSRLPLALRGLAKTLGSRANSPGGVSRRRRLIAFVLILAAFGLAVCGR